MKKLTWAAGGIAAFVATAHLTQPSEGDFKLEIDESIADERMSAINQGNYGEAIVNFFASNLVDGQYEAGLISSSYKVTFAGQVVAECSGMFGIVSCTQE